MLARKRRNGCLMLIILVLGLLAITLAGCTSSNSSSSSGYRYGTKESYDAKYGAGSYDADKELLDSMRDAWNNGN